MPINSSSEQSGATSADDAILLLFCPTGQRLGNAPKSLIALMPATVHGLFFGFFAALGDFPSAMMICHGDEAAGEGNNRPGPPSGYFARDL
jgi:hypothetical protein